MRFYRFIHTDFLLRDLINNFSNALLAHIAKHMKTLRRQHLKFSQSVALSPQKMECRLTGIDLKPNFLYHEN